MPKRILIAILIIIFGIIGANWFLIENPVQQRLKADSRNETVSVHVYYRNFINPSEIVIDLWDVSNSASMADIDRMLLHIADTLQERDFSKIYLSYRSEEKFYFEGLYFNKLGLEFSYQNPIFTIRTMPQNVFSLNGREAFPTWSGGILGVLSKQMEDHNEFHMQWYINELKP